jgi:hypothetical protein
MLDSIRRRSAAADGDDGDDDGKAGGAVLAVDELKARLAAWFRALAFKHHPDRGGDGKVMSALNSARDELYEALGIE